MEPCFTRLFSFCERVYKTSMVFDKPLDAILFDMDGTLCHSGSYYLRQVALDIAWSPLRGKLGPIALMRVLQQFRRVRDRLRELPHVPGLHRVQIEMTAERLRLPYATASEILRKLIYDSAFQGLTTFVEPDARATLLRLKAHPYKLGVLSDYPTQAKLAGMGLLDLGWDVLLSSEDVDSLKPNPLLFQKALEAIGVEPDRALYVGDRRDTDIAGAQAAGMRTCLIKASRHKGPDADFAVSSLRELAESLGC